MRWIWAGMIIISTVTGLFTGNSEAVSQATLTGAKAKAADINGDGKVTATDYVNIKFYVLGKTTITPR